MTKEEDTQGVLRAVDPLVGAEVFATIMVKRVISKENAQKVLWVTKPLVGEGDALPLAAIGVVKWTPLQCISSSIVFTIKTQLALFAILIAADY